MIKSKQADKWRYCCSICKERIRPNNHTWYAEETETSANTATAVLFQFITDLLQLRNTQYKVIKIKTILIFI